MFINTMIGSALKIDVPYKPGTGPVSTDIHRLYSFLIDSEAMLIRVIEGESALKVQIGNGDIECGTTLYLLNNTDEIDGLSIRMIALALRALLGAIDRPLPRSRLTKDQFIRLATSNLVGSDGSILGTGKYETYDQGWLVALTNLIKCLLFKWVYPEGGTWPRPDEGFQPLRASSLSGSRDITVGVLSDWGAGTAGLPSPSPAQRVISALPHDHPDYIVHLGDTYYSGTPSESPPLPGLPGDVDRILADLVNVTFGTHYTAGDLEGVLGFSCLGEERDNLVGLFPPAYADRSFTLNANHEMYSGAYGYFQDALRAPSMFRAQNRYSVFALRVGDWTILGLDTAYASDPYGLYMLGAIGAEQIAWVRDLMREEHIDPSKTILMTHHTGFTYDCALGPTSPSTSACPPGGTASASPHDQYLELWRSVHTALGGYPYAWYWGHIHNAIAYASPITFDSTSATPDPADTRCRCLGHGALPFGAALGLDRNERIQWHIESDSADGRAINGYVTLHFSIDDDGTCSQIVERYRDGTPERTVRFENTLFPPQTS